MRTLLALGSVLFISAFAGSWASPCASNTDRGPIIVTEEPPVIQSPAPLDPIPVGHGQRTELYTNVARNSSQIKSKSETKAIEKVKTRKRKDGSTVTVIVDKSKTKNKTAAISDSYEQANRTVSADGLEDQTSLTKDRQQKLKEISVVKNVKRQKIITDKNGNVISDTVKAKTTERDRKSEKTKESETLIHTVKRVTTEAPELYATAPPKTKTTTEPVRTTRWRCTTTKPPRRPCGCHTTTQAPKRPCGCKRD